MNLTLFYVTLAGTYWYHSHMGAQGTNGLQGGLIIRKKGTTMDQIDRDNIVILQEWYETPTIQAPKSILVNGKGRIAEKTFIYEPREVNRYLRGLGGIFPKEDYEKTKNGTFTTNYESLETPGKDSNIRKQ